MKIISYNVNGIRAALKKGFFNWLKNANPDVICLQEIKAQEEQLELVFLSCWVSIITIGLVLKKKDTVESLFYPKLNQLK
jgi:exonuclease III